jgi:hypothetical protein
MQLAGESIARMQDLVKLTRELLSARLLFQPHAKVASVESAEGIEHLFH